ncbi:PREDICTED: gustatory receptor for bitter taste 93a isoform X2 [Rhagoletis zephyria]|uniref:gustatory receptor for bitter taste 93a isoform X2 n=1 Tax=Rhagoletis zephyria TaxID=28612 RepID=UPI0008119C9C|nr:PREDICTED: gustatory receptor for bitter taste 93a isoform X2 [Rhagoletis zephyria]
MELRKAKRWHRIFILIWRVFVTGFYVKLMPAMFASFLIHADNSFMSILAQLCNLVLLIMCADAVVAKSQLPDSLDLDLICSDIDERWDVSVETFICQRKVENLEISVLGFFHLNNEFILVIISAIMSYLFVLIQFGMTKNSVTAGHAYPHHTLNHS